MDIDALFAPGGVLEQRLPAFGYREAQHEMARLVAHALASGAHAALEGGTGVGKTYAYLIPVLLSGQRTIVSTGTKTLQDQLFAKDLPALGAAIGRPASVAVLKGRANYLCWHRLELGLTDLAHSPAVRRTLESLAEWGRVSDSGDLSELDDLEEDFAFRASVTSTAENCLGTKCEAYDRCFVASARRRAQDARIVVVNHHLLLADLALKDVGFGELLGDADAVIVDEAHLLPEIAQQFFGLSVTAREIDVLLGDVFAELKAAGSPRETESAALALAGVVAGLRKDGRREGGRLPLRAAPKALLDGLEACREGLETLTAELGRLGAARVGIEKCAERAEELTRRLDVVLDAERDDGLRWLEASPRHVGAYWTPFETGKVLSERIEDQACHWIFTSATLAVGEDFSHFLGRVGLSGIDTRTWPSPFDYRANARLFVPDGLPEPGHAGHTIKLCETVWPLVEAAGGGAFLLFTSYRALRAAEEWVAQRRAPGPVLVQGNGARSQLLAEFREYGNAVLLGTGSFWQGVDVRGAALRLVVIDKLPFAAPSDPLVEARIEAIRRGGGDPFLEFQLPEAVLTLKQGAGRLIRDYDDRGLIVLGDPRVRTKAYGKLFLESLPPAPRLESAGAALEFAASLAPAPRAAAPIGAAAH